MQYPGFNFQITHRDATSHARVGLLHTPHGTVETPAFVFCATRAALKGVTLEQATEAGAQFILANTYHLLLQPGPELVAKIGGLHRFMGWKGPLLTDSGGFQIFSLGHGGVADEIKGRRSHAPDKALLKIDEDGATFRSYLDGTIQHLTPERSIEVQRLLGPDFAVVLDECTPFHVDRAYTEASMQRSHRWEDRSLAEFERHHDGRQALYGIVQGGTFEDLRAESSAYVASRPFFGQAVGGTLGGDKAQMQDVIAMAMRGLRNDRPTHLLGIGGIADIWCAAAEGLDTFDCVHPTRLARHGGALVDPLTTKDGKEHLNLKNACYRDDPRPLDETLDCYTNRHFSRAYLHHLLKTGESLAGTLLSIHNIAFMMRLAQHLRQSIQDGSYGEKARQYRALT